MGTLDPTRVPDLLVGLAPTASGACPRCGRATQALANGRSRIEICGGCGTLDVQSREGLDIWSLRGTPVGPAALGAPPVAPSPVAPSPVAPPLGGAPPKRAVARFGWLG